MDQEERAALQMTKDELLAKLNAGRPAEVAHQRPIDAPSRTPGIVFEASQTSTFIGVRIAGAGLSPSEASLRVS
jgi:hypothetical protein